jgi:tetratricopeptide (TPR) repeat protein
MQFSPQLFYAPKRRQIHFLLVSLSISLTAMPMFGEETSLSERIGPLLRESRYTDAKQILDAEIKANPKESLAYALRADADLGMNDAGKAMADCNRAIDLDAASARAFQIRAAVYLQLGQLDRALIDAKKAVSLDPDDVRVLGYEAQIYALRRDYPEALRDLNKAIKVDCKYPDAYSDRAFVYNMLGEYNKALADSNKALSVGREENLAVYKAYGNRARAYLHLAKYADALADANTMVKHYPSYAQAYLLRADIYRKMGKAELAVRDEKLAQKVTGDPKLLWLQKHTYKGVSKQKSP